MNHPGQNMDDLPSNPASLHLLVSNLVDNLPASIFQNKISVKNCVGPEFQMNADKHGVGFVIDELLHTVLSNARNTSISITAERYGGIVILHFEDPNNYNGYALQFSMATVGQSARRIGGEINICGAQKREATISFSFPDTQDA